MGVPPAWLRQGKRVVGALTHSARRRPERTRDRVSEGGRRCASRRPARSAGVEPRTDDRTSCVRCGERVGIHEWSDPQAREQSGGRPDRLRSAPWTSEGRTRVPGSGMARRPEGPRPGEALASPQRGHEGSRVRPEYERPEPCGGRDDNHRAGLPWADGLPAGSGVGRGTKAQERPTTTQRGRASAHPPPRATPGGEHHQQWNGGTTLEG